MLQYAVSDLSARYKCIVFEECNWEMVHSNKTLFQGTKNWVDMAVSNTNCYAYKVLTYFKALVICSNDFWKGCSPEAKKYLDPNIIYVKVTDFLYERTPEAVAA